VLYCRKLSPNIVNEESLL